MVDHKSNITTSDDFRANVGVAVAAVISVFVVVVLGFEPIGPGVEGVGGIPTTLISVYLLGWLLFSIGYVLWTHLALASLTEIQLIVHARWAQVRQRRWWVQWLGTGGAVSWTMVSAFIAIFLNIYIANSDNAQNSVVAIVFGLLNVVVSWVVMIYSFAIDYLRLDLGGGGSAKARHLQFDMPEARSFGDYLTFSVLSSTMTAALPGKAVTARGWRLVRVNVIVAFAFNSIVVATLVSLTVSYLLA